MCSSGCPAQRPFAPPPPPPQCRPPGKVAGSDPATRRRRRRRRRRRLPPPPPPSSPAAAIAAATAALRLRLRLRRLRVHPLIPPPPPPPQALTGSATKASRGIPSAGRAAEVRGAAAVTVPDRAPSTLGGTACLRLCRVALKRSQHPDSGHYPSQPEPRSRPRLGGSSRGGGFWPLLMPARRPPRWIHSKLENDARVRACSAVVCRIGPGGQTHWDRDLTAPSVLSFARGLIKS